MTFTINVPYRLVAALLTLALVSGCAASRKSALEDGAPAEGKVAGDFDKTLAEARAHWQKRVHRSDVEKAITSWQQAADIDLSALPEDERRAQRAQVYEELSHAYFFLASNHIEAEDGDEKARDESMMVNYEKGMTAAEKAIKLRAPEFAAKVAQGDPWADHLDLVDDSAIPALYWYAVNLGKWGMLEGPATILARQNDLQAIMKHICAADESYYYGACHRFFAVYWTKLPFSSDAQKSKAHFDKAIELAPNFLANKVLMAQHYATMTGDRKLYDRLLSEVSDTPEDVLAEATPENHFAKEKAEQLRKSADKRFE